jgi:endonuclease/exonuclease/phosphatase family metal-dependent hydrolase
MVALFLGTLTALEYKPKPIELLVVENNQNNNVLKNTEMTIMTFNIGYAGLGANEDFIMDGGQNGIPENKEVVETYFSGIKDILSDHPVDFYLMQEIDVKARRSYHMNQYTGLKDHLGDSYSSQFAYNFKAPFVPFPVSLTDYIGFVHSGIATYSTYRVNESTRYQFPGAFSWPLRVANLKRGMMVSTYAIEGSDKMFHVVNLHMSAYDASGTLREQEMAFLKQYLEEQEALGNYVIVGGDFNQTFPAAKDVYPTKDGLWEAYPIENDFLPSGYRFEIDLLHPTCRLLNQPYQPDSALTQYYIIDGFIVSNNIQVLSYDGLSVGAMTLNLDFQSSDHNPVVMKFKLI